MKYASFSNIYTFWIHPSALYNAQFPWNFNGGWGNYHELVRYKLDAFAL